MTVLPFRIQWCIGASGAASSETEAARQKPMLPAFAPDPVPSCQPKQDANGRMHSFRQETCSAQVAPSQQPGEERVLPSQPIAEEKETGCPLTPANDGAAQGVSMLSDELRQMSPASASHQHSCRTSFDRTLAHAIQDYLEDQKRQHRRPKTLEWHEQALGLFQRYLLTEHQCILLNQITEAQVGGWLAALPLMSTAIGTHRSAGTVASYARSARAFCQWLVRHRYLPATPFAHLHLPPVETCSPHPIEPEEWDQLLLACHPPKQTGALADRTAARNCALLWMLFDTGMRVSEICRLRLGDVDREQGTLSVQGKGATARRLTLGHEGLCHLLGYLDRSRLKVAACFERRDASTEYLFLSEAGRPLTKSALALVFGRLRQRAGITRKGMSLSLLRESFAARYLQAGGDLTTLWELLGQKESGTFEHCVRMCDEAVDDQMQRSLERAIDSEPLADEGTR